jgi:hypothetical protein
MQARESTDIQGPIRRQQNASEPDCFCSAYASNAQPFAFGHHREEIGENVSANRTVLEREKLGKLSFIHVAQTVQGQTIE